VEEGVVGYEPAPLPWRTRLLQGAVGFAGVGVCVAAMALLDAFKFLSDLVFPTLLALWILLGAPWVFKRLGWAEQGEERGGGIPLMVGVARR
jgi:peptidoglycan/LPS O-acetylase OafA/YrhL